MTAVGLVDYERAAARQREPAERRYLLSSLSVRPPVASGISKWLYRQISQDVCPWNVRFAKELPDDSPFAARAAIAAKDAHTVARELLAMTQEEFSRAFRGSPMKRVKLRGLKRNAAVVLGNVGTMEDVPVLRQAADDPDPLVRKHAAWALGRLQPTEAGAPDPVHSDRTPTHPTLPNR